VAGKDCGYARRCKTMRVIKIFLIVSFSGLFSSCIIGFFMTDTVTPVYIVNNSDKTIYLDSTYLIYNLDKKESNEGKKALPNDSVLIVNMWGNISMDNTRETYLKLVKSNLDGNNRESVTFKYNEKDYYLSPDDIADMIVDKATFESKKHRYHQNVTTYSVYIDITDITDI
jgi:hypothetical protein